MNAIWPASFSTGSSVELVAEVHAAGRARRMVSGADDSAKLPEASDQMPWPPVPLRQGTVCSKCDLSGVIQVGRGA